MILLFTPHPPVLRWQRVGPGCRLGERGECDAAGCEPVLHRAAGAGALEAVGYLLLHGGEAVAEEVRRLGPEDLPGLAATVPYLPEANDLTLAAVRAGLAVVPAIDHFLLCDTAFFSALPAEASQYAIPIRLRRRGLRRFGACGVWHRWAWEQVRHRGRGEISRVLSVYLGNGTNLAAIRDGGPVETTVGFTGLEGIPSATGCGDLDPMIPLHLRASGMTFAEISRLLGRGSGFGGLLGKPCSLRRLLTEETDPAVHEVRELYLYSLCKHAGSLIAALGGIDAVAVVGEEGDLCERVAGLLAGWISPVRRAEPGPASGELQSLAFSGKRNQILAEQIRRAQSRGGHHDG
ncbi:MAG: hypothetical protein WDA75_07955 [Candidatus Latescibacterota bacterium]|jgi:acetate kinase